MFRPTDMDPRIKGVIRRPRIVSITWLASFAHHAHRPVPKHMNGFLLARCLLLISILSTDERYFVNTILLISLLSLQCVLISILLLSLQWVIMKTKTDFLRYICYRNFINDLIKHVSLQTVVHIRLLVCTNCYPCLTAVKKNIDTVFCLRKGRN